MDKSVGGFLVGLLLIASPILLLGTFENEMIRLLLLFVSICGGFIAVTYGVKMERKYVYNK
ncbi:hypothetical protein AUR64_12200 [Haloprofundus marisrubri]|uniref:Uncharacterized protein n=1 Tax=Haloprofundus marisrubri TaxID=1514971 RepID=A0A0W1RA51_9EURY|nr:hypothetical protein AUR64_12200 [Haloprofundus marisrubri]